MHSKDNTPVNTTGRCIMQLAKMSIDPDFVELTTDVFSEVLLQNNESNQILRLYDQKHMYFMFSLPQQVKGQEGLDFRH